MQKKKEISLSMIRKFLNGLGGVNFRLRDPVKMIKEALIAADHPPYSNSQIKKKVAICCRMIRNKKYYWNKIKAAKNNHN